MTQTLISRLPRLACLTAAAGFVTLIGAGCTSTSDRFSNGVVDGLTSIVTPYRIDIVQGNVVTEEQMKLLKPGLTKLQVRNLLGSPLLTDPFHAQRWDYVFSIRRPGVDPQLRTVTVRFDGDTVASVDAPDTMPTEQAFVASISRENPKAKIPKLELTPEERAALPVSPLPPATTAPEAPATGPTRDYPPLESAAPAAASEPSS